MENLLSIVSKYSTHEQEQTAQTALFTMKLLAKRLAEKHPTEFSSVSFFLNFALFFKDDISRLYTYIY